VDLFLELLPIWMFVVLGLLLFSGYPVAFILGGIGLAFAVIGDMVGMFRIQQLSLIPLRIYGSTMESPVLVAIPMFIFMGTMLEKSGVARDLLYALQVLLRRVPGGLALSVTLMGTIMAATTGIIGASVVMMTLMALPVMLERKYSIQLATGTIAASGTLGILIPPSITMILYGIATETSSGRLFLAGVIPGIMLVLMFAIYAWVASLITGPTGTAAARALAARRYSMKEKFEGLGRVSPFIMIVIMIGYAMYGGIATPSEVAAISAALAIALVVVIYKARTKESQWRIFRETVRESTMILLIIAAAAAFSYMMSL
jgi:tripartite ATP-independent transporter DctM subunit